MIFDNALNRFESRELPPLDFSVDPSVAARARVALIVNKAKLDGVRPAEVVVEDELPGVRWFE